MAGEGFMMNANNRIRQNRRMLDKSKFRENDLNPLYSKERKMQKDPDNVFVETKPISPERQLQIKKKVQKEHRKSLLVNGVIALCILLVILVVFLIYG